MTIDTGPPYPLPPLPSGIGSGFAIGISPIGTPQAYNYWQSVLAQYANSPIITQLISNFFQYVDLTQLLDDFFDNIWNIDEATGYGLDVWGRIVGVTRVLRLTSGKFWGFEEATDADPFEQSPFFTGTLISNNFTLDDNSYRTLIFAKALANISDGSIPSINQLLLNLFPKRGNCFVTDIGNMQLAYTFSFPLAPVELAIVEQSGALPKSVGVTASVIII